MTATSRTTAPSGRKRTATVVTIPGRTAASATAYPAVTRSTTPAIVSSGRGSVKGNANAEPHRGGAVGRPGAPTPKKILPPAWNRGIVPAQGNPIPDLGDKDAGTALNRGREAATGAGAPRMNWS